MRIKFEQATTSQFKAAANAAGLTDISGRFLIAIEGRGLAARERSHMTEMMRKMGYIEIEMIDGVVLPVKTIAPPEKFVRNRRRRE